MELREALPIMRSAELAAKLAAQRLQRDSRREPRDGTALIADYENSPLRKFHDDFYSQEHEPPERWPETYDRVPLETWPACGRVDGRAA